MPFELRSKDEKGKNAIRINSAKESKGCFINHKSQIENRQSQIENWKSVIPA